MTTDEVMARFGITRPAACRWAAQNGVARTQVKGILAFDWTEGDIRRFAQRPPKGRPRKDAPSEKD